MNQGSCNAHKQFVCRFHITACAPSSSAAWRAGCPPKPHNALRHHLMQALNFSIKVSMCGDFNAKIDVRMKAQQQS
eukprot:1158586-Pelagomonas_calceolata.AAC.2